VYPIIIQNHDNVSGRIVEHGKNLANEIPGAALLTLEGTGDTKSVQLTNKYDKFCHKRLTARKAGDYKE
jgi:hypothetical protein